MRKLPLLLVLLLLPVLVASVSAQASALSGVPQPAPVLLAEAEEEDEPEEPEEEDEAEEAEIEREICEEDPELCEKEPVGGSEPTSDPCLLRKASATVTANPGKRRLRLTVHYRTAKPATVTVQTTLQGPKGAVRLGTEHVRFRRSGVYRDTYALSEKQTKKALAANRFAVKLHVVNTPPSCGLALTGATRRAKR